MEIDFITTHHKKTKRNYLERVNKINKAEAAIKAKKWDYDYWDGSRDINYGGYHYDGRWEPIAKKMIAPEFRACGVWSLRATAQSYIEQNHGTDLWATLQPILGEIDAVKAELQHAPQFKSDVE